MTGMLSRMTGPQDSTRIVPSSGGPISECTTDADNVTVDAEIANGMSRGTFWTWATLSTLSTLVVYSS